MGMNRCIGERGDTLPSRRNVTYQDKPWRFVVPLYLKITGVWGEVSESSRVKNNRFEREDLVICSIEVVAVH